MASERQIAANRRNATMSTGPQSEGGKRRSSQNSRTHGLFAAQVVGPGEDREAYQAFHDDLYEDLNPVGAMEEQLVELIIDKLLRLRKIPEIHTGILAFSYYAVRRNRARRKMSGQEESIYGELRNTVVANKDLHVQAENERDEAAAGLEGPLPLLGAEFRGAEQVLSRLIKIANAIEGSLYRALKELKEMRAERQKAAIISIPVEEQQHAPPPRHRERSR